MAAETRDRYAPMYQQPLSEQEAHAGQSYQLTVLNPLLGVLGNAPHIVDVASGRGEAAVYLRSHGAQIIRTDISHRGLEWNTGPSVVADAMAQPFPSGMFDAIHMKDALVNIENQEELFHEFYRLLRPDGIAVVTSVDQAKTAFSYVLGNERNKITVESMDEYHTHTAELIRRGATVFTQYPVLPARVAQHLHQAGFESILLASWRSKELDWYPHATKRHVYFASKYEKDERIDRMAQEIASGKMV